MHVSNSRQKRNGEKRQNTTSCMLSAQLLEIHQHGGPEKDFSDTSGWLALLPSPAMQKGDSPTAVPTAPGRPRPYPFPRAIATAEIAQAAPRVRGSGSGRARSAATRSRRPRPRRGARRWGRAAGGHPTWHGTTGTHAQHFGPCGSRGGGGRAGREEGTRAKHAHRSPRGLPRFPAGTCQGQQGPAAEPALGPGRPAATAGARPRRAAISLPAGCQAAAASRDRDRDAAPAGTQGPGSPRRSRTAAAHPSPSLGRQEGAGGCAAPHPFTPPGSRRRGAGFASRGPARPGPASPHRPRGPATGRAPNGRAHQGKRVRGAGRGGALSHFPPPLPPGAAEGAGQRVEWARGAGTAFLPWGPLWVRLGGRGGVTGGMPGCRGLASLCMSVCVCAAFPFSPARVRGGGRVRPGSGHGGGCGPAWLRAGGRAPGARGLSAVGPGQCCGAGREGADRCPAPAWGGELPSPGGQRRLTAGWPLVKLSRGRTGRRCGRWRLQGKAWAEGSARTAAASCPNAPLGSPRWRWALLKPSPERTVSCQPPQNTPLGVTGNNLSNTFLAPCSA